MLTVADLVRQPFPALLEPITGLDHGQRVRHVLIADALDDLRDSRRGEAVILTPRLSSDLSGFRLDVALRMASEHGVAAVIVYGPPTASLTAMRIADRGRIALLAAPFGQPLTKLAFGIGRLLHRDPAETLSRVLDALDAITLAEPDGSQAVISRAGAAFGATLDIGEIPVEHSAPILVEGRRDGFVNAHGDEDEARLIAHLAAAAVGRVREAERRAARNRRQAHADVLADLLLAPERRLPRLAERAHDLGVVLDGVVTVAQLDVDLSTEPGSSDPPDGGALEDELNDLVLDALEHRSGRWHHARIDRAMLIVHTQRIGAHRPSRAGEAEPLDYALAAIGVEHPNARVFCGVGEPGTGVEGLRRSATEAAAAAAAARNTGREGTAVRISTIGLPRVLIEWLASRGGQESVSRLLARLDALGPARAQVAIETLSVYLDERGSLKACAERLHLHRNAVAYRMRAIRERLELDLDDPDQRLALQLACRARALHRDG